MLEDLENYFKSTTIKQVEKDWEETKQSDEIGPTVDEFILITNQEVENGDSRS